MQVLPCHRERVRCLAGLQIEDLWQQRPHVACCVLRVSVCERFLPRNYLAMNIIYDRALVGVVLVRDTFPSTGETCTAEDELALLTAVEGRSKSVRHTLGVTRSRVSR